MKKENLYKILLAIGLIIGIKSYFLAQTSGRNIDLEQLHREFPNEQKSFAALESGLTHYELLPGAKPNVTAVMIHGVSGPMNVWDHTVQALQTDEISTLRYDLYGRGYSERVDGDYDLNFYLQQLEELLAETAINEKVHLIGSSFGSVIASAYAIKFPDRVLSLTLIGPAGFPLKTPPLAQLRDIPLLGNLIFSLMGQNIIKEQNKKYFVDGKVWAQQNEYFAAQLNVKGSDLAILSTLRNSPVQSFVAEFAKINNLTFPVLVVWGEEDQTFPFANNEILKEKISRLKLIAIPKSAHLPQYERPEMVNPFIVSFLEGIDTNE